MNKTLNKHTDKFIKRLCIKLNLPDKTKNKISWALRDTHE